MKAIAAKGGVIQVNAHSSYMIAPVHTAERDKVLADRPYRPAAP